MELRDLIEGKERIIDEAGQKLCKDTARHIRYEINWLISKSENNTWRSFEDALEDRLSSKEYSDITKRNKKRYFQYIHRILNPGAIPERKVYSYDSDPLDRFRDSKSYGELTKTYRDIIETYISNAEKEGKKKDTIYVHCSLASGFLRYLQEKGCTQLEEATSDAIVAFFYSDKLYEHQIRSYSYKEKLSVVLKSCSSVARYSSGCRHVLNLIPDFKYVRKNVEYLTESEAEAIREIIETEGFSARDRAIMILLLYTGLRSCDVAAIKTTDINWENETVTIIQQKTSEPITIAMLPSVGNAIFDYLSETESPSHTGYLFYQEGCADRCISAKTVRNIAYKAYKWAGIRQNKGDHKGTHLFRHYTATKMLENGIERSVISKVLGHTDPDSLGTYLHTDFKHLSDFALSLDTFPVSEEVWYI